MRDQSQERKHGLTYALFSAALGASAFVASAAQASTFAIVPLGTGEHLRTRLLETAFSSEGASNKIKGDTEGKCGEGKCGEGKCGGGSSSSHDTE